MTMPKKPVHNAKLIAKTDKTKALAKKLKSRPVKLVRGFKRGG